MEKILINIKELSELLGISVSTLYTWVSQRKIPYSKIGHSVKFDLTRMEKWIKEHSVEPRKLWM